METLRAITSDSGRIVYALKELPSDLAALEQECPGVRLVVGDGEHGRVERVDRVGYGVLVVEFGEGLAVETVNAALLPRLVPFGVIAVTPGRSLEEAYLGK